MSWQLWQRIAPAVENLAFGREVGKLLGDRHVTGDGTTDEPADK